MNKMIVVALLSCVCLTPGAVRAEAPSLGTVAPASAPFKKELEQAYRLKESGRNAESAVVFAAILKKNPNNHAALTELGYLNLGLKKYESAAKYLGLASAQAPDDMRLRMDLAYASQALARPAAAVREFTVVASRTGEFQMQARKELGFINLAAGRFVEAAADFEVVRAAEPQDDAVVLQLGHTYMRMKEIMKAREAFVAASMSADKKVSGAAEAALKSAQEPAAASSL